MDKLRSRWGAHKPTTRRLAQVYAALLYNAHVKGFVSGQIYTGSAKALCVPGLNCYSCPGAIAACPLGALQNALAASGHTAGWYVFGMLLLFGITLGRTICGWLCPVGLIQELQHRIPTPKLRKSRLTRALSWLKYGILIVFVIAVPLIYAFRHNLPVPAFCKYICPAGTLEGAAPLLQNSQNAGLFAQLGSLFTGKLIIMLMIGLACVFCYRAFCRFLCPLGAIYSLFNRFALTGMRVDASRCNGCGACAHACGMDIKQVGDRECIACGQCIPACAQGAITMRCGRVTLMDAISGEQMGRVKMIRRAVWAGLLALLIMIFALVNLTGGQEAQPVSTGEITSETDIGFEPGQRLEDFTCMLMDGSTFALSEVRGRVVMINLWATYCTPCVDELPLFERLQEEHPEIVVLAVHHWLEASPTTEVYIAQNGWMDWQLRFAVDTADQNILRKIGGGNTMPRTVVLNANGEVIYNEQRSVTWEMLTSLLEAAKAS